LFVCPLHLSARAPSGQCLGLSILFVRICPHLFDQLFHIVLLFAHVTHSLDWANEYLATNAISTAGTFVISNIVKILLATRPIPF
jgi:hypothetical protein